MENRLSGERERKRIYIVDCSLIRLGVGSEDKFYIIVLIQRVTKLTLCSDQVILSSQDDKNMKQNGRSRDKP